jgi:hypothetical protein
MRLSRTKTDKTLEMDGVWVAIRYGVEVNVSRMGNPRAEAWRAELSPEDRRLLDNVKEYTRRPELYKAQIERAGDLMRDNIAETVLNGWRGIEAEDDAEDCKEGEPLPFTVERAKKAMAEYDWLYQDVLEAATTRETFFRAEVRETGNSSRKSSGGKGATPKS